MENHLRRTPRRRLTAALLGLFLLGTLLLVAAPPALAGPVPDEPDASTAQLGLAIDDGHYEGLLGLYNYDNTGKQFLWLNRFTPGPEAFPYTLDKISVLFDSLSGGNPVRPGDAIQLAVYSDDDGNPNNGARLIATYDRTVQAVDGQTWSEYPLDAPIEFTTPGDILIGVINRFTQDSISPKSYPAAYDNTNCQDRSYYGWWPGGVNNPPELNTWAALRPQTGNWMIRGSGWSSGVQGTPAPIAPPEIPAPTPTPPVSNLPRLRIFLPFAINH